MSLTQLLLHTITASYAEVILHVMYEISEILKFWQLFILFYLSIFY